MTDERAGHFQTGGAGYASFRPRWPDALARALAEAAPDRGLAVDVGCGSGQLTTRLAPHFALTLGLDIAAGQLREAEAAPGAAYAVASASALPVADGRAALIAVGQAAHWFDLPAFYAEATRIARPGAVLALLSYGPAEVAGPLGPAFARLRQGIAGWWPPERAHVETDYRDLPFPFDALALPRFDIARTWPRSQLVGYVETFSAVRRARAAGAGGAADAFAAEAEAVLPDDGPVHLRFPVAIRAARLG